ncbi:MAG: cobalt-precorrin-5B (C(1))-methyltransferase [Pseudomonadota bacterium]
MLSPMARKPDGDLRHGYTTGACATAAAKAAYGALLGRGWINPVSIVLPRGEVVAFDLVETAFGEGWATASVQKDAGDDPDVTHGALVRATLRPAAPGAGVVFRAGEGVGMVTKPGLMIPPGEPAINPVPRDMIRGAIAELQHPADVEVEIAIPGGAALAEKTWNPRLGVEGGLSILGTTGIVRPYSCAAWIASIHRGIDVARANGVTHALASTGATSEAAAQARLGLPAHASLDMGDFAGGLLKYLRRHPIPRLTIAGGFAKLAKLAAGALDLHSGRSQVDFAFLAGLARDAGCNPVPVAAANTAKEALDHAGPRLADAVAVRARAAALEALAGARVEVEVLVVDRGGRIVAEARTPLGHTA